MERTTPGARPLVVRLVGFAIVLLVGLPKTSEGRVDFRRDIEPLLSHHCYECHGPTSREGGLRLTSRKEAFQPGDFGVPVIAPGSAEFSLLVDMIEASDPTERMPRKRPALEPQQIELLRRWIDQGAQWPADADAAAGHWAYLPIERSPPSNLATQTQPAQTIDGFVRKALSEKGLSPAARASQTALVRRVHFDLIGLPPAPARVEAFLEDPSDASYENLVDQLLASPQFGERWAIPWLDLARYADSTGFMSEAMLSNWPYRDWVVEAINDDMPFDQFTIEQLAGDLLSEATLEQRIATGFHRAAPLPLEAGVREEEARITQVIDRVNTTGTAWLGSTVACAQCHDHKFDPISQEEYFGLLAFFNNTALEAVSTDGMGGVVLQPKGPRVKLPHSDESRQEVIDLVTELIAEMSNTQPEAVPGGVVFSPDSRERLQGGARAMDGRAIFSEIEDVLVQQLDGAQTNSSAWRQDWLAETRKRLENRPPAWETLKVLNTHGTADAKQGKGGWIHTRGQFDGFARITLEMESELAELRALKLTLLARPNNPRNSRFPVAEVELQGPTQPAPARVAESYATTTSPRRGARAAHDGNSETAWVIRNAEERRQNQSLVLVLDEPLAVGEDGTVQVHLELDGLSGASGRYLRLEASDAPRRLVGLPPNLQEAIRAHSWEDLSAQQQNRLQSRALRDVLPELETSLRKARSLAENQIPKLPVAHVMKEEEPRKTRIFERGDPHVPGSEVRAGTPAILHPFSPSDAPTRLDLARWIVAPENPLTARVTVNRWWGQLFGHPLVDTPEDFGIRGSRPSHPELLDFLASELIDSGWRRKALVRQMVLSETYKQATIPATPEALVADPENRLLSRAERIRLPAETIRDNALQIAGLLQLKVGGPPVSPPQPEGVWMRNGVRSASYRPSSGIDRYRRGLYTIIRRTSPYPSFLNFDATDRTACRARRQESNTPLQALNLLNDEVFREAALAFAQRILSTYPDASDKERIHHAFVQAVSRTATHEETELLLEVLTERARTNQETPRTVDAILEYPHFRANPNISRNELASWFSVARILLNLDETIHRG